MARPTVTLLLSDGRRLAVPPGAIIGRSPRADVSIADPRVSEVHAFLSLRRGALWMLPARRPIFVDAVAQAQLLLRTGVRVHLTPEVWLLVEAVLLPPRRPELRRGEHQLGFDEHDELSLTPTGLLVPGHDAGALLWAWSGGDVVFLHPRDGEPHPAQVGQVVHVGAWQVEVVTSTGEIAETAASRPAITLQDHGDEVVLQGGSHTLPLRRLNAALLRALGARGGRSTVLELACAVWEDLDLEEASLRRARSRAEEESRRARQALRHARQPDAALVEALHEAERGEAELATRWETLQQRASARVSNQVYRVHEAMADHGLDIELLRCTGRREVSLLGATWSALQ